MIILFFALLPNRIKGFCSYHLFSLISFFLILFGDANNNLFKFIFLNRPILFLGTLSFGIYLCHPLVIELVRGYSIANPYLLLFVVMFTSIFFSVLTYNFIEKPGMRMGKIFYMKMIQVKNAFC